MIPRYTRPAMGRIWSEEHRFRAWLEVETVASEVLAEDGIVPREAAQAIRKKGDFDLERIHAIEAEVKHDVIAFTTAVAEKVGPEARWLQQGVSLFLGSLPSLNVHSQWAWARQERLTRLSRARLREHKTSEDKQRNCER